MPELDHKASEIFAGKVVRKDLVCQVKVGANVPTYVLEYLLGNYMESGSFSRGREELVAEASMVFAGNIDQPVDVLARTGTLFQPLPEEMQDMALIDRSYTRRAIPLLRKSGNIWSWLSRGAGASKNN